MPMVPQIVIASTHDTSFVPQLYILIRSIKDNKRPDTVVIYHAFIPFTEEYNQEYFDKLFADIVDDKFYVIVTDAGPFLQLIGDIEGSKMPKICYLRCLLPSHFHHLSRLLYLDVDIVCLSPGLEELWETDMDGCYVAAVADTGVTYMAQYAAERKQVGDPPYFNAGVMLLNLEQMRRDGVDKELADWLTDWDAEELKPIVEDQSLVNYLFNGRVKELPLRYNNQLLTVWGPRVPAAERLAVDNGYKYPLDSIKDTVLMHFSDHDKPWSTRLSFPAVTYPYLSESRAIWKYAVEKYDDKHLAAPAWKDTVFIASTATADRKDKVWILLNSLKQNKQPGTLIQYYLFVPSEELKEFQTYLTGLPSEDFKVLILDVDWFADKVDTRGTIRDHLYYAKCLFPQVFLNQDKLLFLDVDIVCVGPGIEDLWNTDIEGYWVGAVIDPTWQYCPYFKHDPQNIGTDHYINAGVMLMNFKQIREDGKDKEFAEWCLHWDQSKLLCHCFDQTLCNYILKDKIKLLPFKYNNSVLATLGIAQDSYRYHLNQCGYVEPLDSLQHAVLLHFCGSKKPWDAKALACGPDEYLYKEEAVELWQQLVRKYGPETDDDEDVIQEDFGLTLSVQTPSWYVYDG